jgi:protease-4
LFLGVAYVVVIGAALVGGYYLAITLIPTPKIGIIPVEFIVDEYMVKAISPEINYARNAPDIKGVVLLIDSPGGSAAAGHDIYYQVRKLREEKPVVASIESLAASAAYQIAVAGNEVYGKPASIIGNVGVIFSQPFPETLSEDYLTTGPYKATGGSPTAFLKKLDLLYADFRDSVVAERSAAPNPLKLTPDELATGEIWIGVEAKEYGIIDELGSTLDAADAAAGLAHLRNYQIVTIRDEYLKSLETDEDVEAAEARYEALENQPGLSFSTQEPEWPTFYQIYIPLE